MVKLLFNRNKNEWVDAPEDLSDDRWVLTLDGYLRKVLDAVKKDLKRDLDRAICICGEVGSGKSNLGRICARYVSNENFNPRDHMVRSVEDMKTVFLKAKRGEAVIFDEASGIFSSTDTMTKKTKYASYVLDVCRQKNLLLIIIAPRFHRLKSDVAVDRTKFLLRSYMSKNDGSRGPFAFYGTRLKEKLYIVLRKSHGNYNLVRPKWRGTVGQDKSYTNEYLKMKDETLKIALESFEDTKMSPTAIRKHAIHELIWKNKDKRAEEVAEIVGFAPNYIRNIWQRFREKELLTKIKEGTLSE